MRARRDRQQRADANVNTHLLCAVSKAQFPVCNDGCTGNPFRTQESCPVPCDFGDVCVCLVFSVKLSVPQGRGFGQYLSLWAHSRSSLIKQKKESLVAFCSQAPGTHSLSLGSALPHLPSCLSWKDSLPHTLSSSSSRRQGSRPSAEKWSSFTVLMTLYISA